MMDVNPSGGPNLPGLDALQGKSSTKRIGQILIEEGAISVSDLERALAIQQEKGGFIGQIMVEMGLVKQETIVSSLVKQCKIPHLSLLDYEIGKDVLELVPKEICLKHHLLPIDKLGKILTVAMVNPLDTEALDEVRKTCPDLRIKPILCDWQHFSTVSSRVFGSDGQPKKEQNSYSMAGLGLTTAKPKQQAPETKPQQHASGDSNAAVMAAVKDIIRDAGAESAARNTASAPAVSGMSAQELTASMRESMSAAMQEAMATIMVQLQGAGERPSSPSYSPQELSGIIREGVASAMQEAVKGISTQVQQAMSHTPVVPSPSGPTPSEIASVLRESINGAMSESMALFAAQLKQTAPQQATLQGPSPAELAAVMQQSFSVSLKEAVGALANEIRTSQQQQAPAANLAGDIAGAVRSALKEVFSEAEATAVAQAVQKDLEQRKSSTGKAGRGGGIRSLFGKKAKLQVLEGNENAENNADDLVSAALNSVDTIEQHTFDTFLPGNNNEFAYKLCKGIAEKPGSDFNPLFLYGEVGIGKTHLINAIGNAIRVRDAAARVGYVSASRFASQLAEAQRSLDMDFFRDEYCHWDVLILDDIQFLGGRVEAQEEFFHIFNALQQQHRQIVIAADKSPDRLGLLEERLVSRFGGGVVTQLKAPDWETRVKILKQQVEAAGGKVAPDVLSVLATRVPNDVRKMIGALRKVIAYAQMVNADVSCEMASDILSHLSSEDAA